MEPFALEVISRLPLAEAVWRLWRQVLGDDFLSDLFGRYRATGSEQKVTFAVLVRLITEALLDHHGSGRQSFRAGRNSGLLCSSDAAVYGKLRRLPLPLSEAFLREATQRMRAMLPPDAASEVPPALREFSVLIVDGKKLKRLPKRLAPLRQTHGKVLGGKVVAGLLLEEGLVVAMHASPDGEANDAPLTPGLLAQVPVAGRRLYVADRQFCDLKIPRGIDEQSDAYVIRYSKKMLFFPEGTARQQVVEGRPVVDVQGWLGRVQDPRRMYVRQITLSRDDQEDIILVTNLLDADRYPAEALLQVYLARWTIERVFQQVTEVFHLDKLVSSSPQGAIFQFALCTLLYNLIQVLRRHIAAAHQRPARTLSSEMIFTDTRKQLVASAQLIPPDQLQDWLAEPLDDAALARRLRELTAQVWSDLWIKCPSKKRRPPQPKQRVPGNHSSAWKLIQQAKPPPR